MAVSYTPDSITGNLTSAYISNELSKLATALQDAVSRSGDTPNTLTATLDVNSQRLINCVDPTSDQEPVTKGYGDSTYGDSAAAVQAAADAEAALASTQAIAGGLSGLIYNTAVADANPISIPLNAATELGWRVEIIGLMNVATFPSITVNSIATGYNTYYRQADYVGTTNTITSNSGVTAWQLGPTGTAFDDINIKFDLDFRGGPEIFLSGKCTRIFGSPQATWEFEGDNIVATPTSLDIPGGIFQVGTKIRVYTKDSTYTPGTPAVQAAFDIAAQSTGSPLGTTVPLTIFLMEAATAYTIPAAGHVGHCKTAPTGSDAIFTVYVNGGSIGTFTFTVAGGDNQDVTSSLTNTAVAIGDLVEVRLTTADSNDVMQDVTMTVKGTV